MSEPTGARQVAFAVLRKSFERGARTELAFREAADTVQLEGRERAFAQRLAYGAVQRCATADHFLARLADREAAELDPPIVAALRLGIYELLFADAVPDYATIDQAVELAKAAGAARGKGLVNAVLRRAARERPQLLAGLSETNAEEAAILHSVPPWLSRLWWAELGPRDARLLLAASNEPAESSFRVNTLRASPPELVSELRGAGVLARSASAEAPLDAAEMLLIDQQIGEPTLERVRAGELTPQSRGSAAVVELLDPRPGERVLELCAGPGTKTGQIAARMGDRGEVVAIDVNRDRLGQVRAQTERLGISCVRYVLADGAQATFDIGYDRVLVDAPCSDLGALASRPDARWRKSEQLIERLAALQGALLRNAAGAVRPGGVLIYSSCTVSRRENEDLVAAFLAEGAAAGLSALDLGGRYPNLASALDSRFLQIRPDRDGTTGFFIAALKRDD